MRSTLRRLALAASMVASVTGPASATVCATAAERSALDARVLQTELMIAALGCGENGRYAAFVHKFNGELVSRGQTMRRYFERAYGARAEERINHLVTDLANEASERRNAWSINYCLFASALFDHVLALAPETFGAFAGRQPFAASHGVSACRR